MNRREFLEALAGIPLLGLLVKVPKAEEEASYTWGNPRELGIGYADNAGEGSLSIGSLISEKDWIDILGCGPIPEREKPGISRWDGQEWIQV